jgi:hypothetical protein
VIQNYFQTAHRELFRSKTASVLHKNQLARNSHLLNIHRLACKVATTSENKWAEMGDFA